MKTPKYVVLAEQLRDQIEQGVLKPGDRLPSFVEMRAMHGVTPTTVERVYARLEQDSLIVRERGRGTFVKQRDRRAVNGVIGISGISFSQQPPPYWFNLMEGFQDVASKAGVELLLLNEKSEISWDKVDGVLTYDSHAADRERTLRQLPPGMPCVTALDAERDLVSVIADDYQGAYDLAKYLVELGHRRIGYIYDPLSPARLTGYRTALRDAGLAVDDRLMRPVPPYDASDECAYTLFGQTTMRQWLETDWAESGCTAVMTQNDDTAIGVMNALSQAGLSVPEQVSVAGFDGTDIGRYFLPSITSVEVPLREIAATAMELLLRQVNGEKMNPWTMVLPTRVVEGNSTARLVQK
jgi:DNA-binding LacI/PurR family transcriptional regulator